MTTGVSDLDGLFKQVYAEDLINLVPENLHVIRDIGFVSPRNMIGKLYNQPVVVQQENGVTYAAPDSGAYSLNSAISMKMANAQVNTPQITLRSAIDSESVAKSTNGGAAAFREATELQMENVVQSVSKRVEISALYGQVGIGLADSSSNATTTSTVVTFTLGSFAPGIWSGTEGAQVQFFDSVTGALISSNADSIFTVGTVNPASRTVKFTGTATGITALDAALTSTSQCDVYFNSARVSASVWNEQVGLYKIMSNTASTIFGVDASTYSLWQGNQYAVGGVALTLAKLQSAVALPFARGGLDEGVTAYISTGAWANLMTDQAALRMYDSSYSTVKMDNGARKLTFYSQNGQIDITAHPYVKPQDAFVVPVKRCKRVGSTDLTFNPIGPNAKIFTAMSDNEGFQFRCYTAQQIFCDSPAKTVLLTGIVNS